MPTRQPKTERDVRSLARSHTASAIKVLAGIMNSKKAAANARIAAANSLLERGHGKAPTTLTDEDGQTLQVEIVRYGQPVVTKRKKSEDDEPEAIGESLSAAEPPSKAVN